MPETTTSAPRPVDLMRAADIVLTARQDTSAGLVARREQLVPIVGDMVTEIGALRETADAYREDLEDARTALANARSFRLVHPFMAVDPAVHTPERVGAYLAARGWRRRVKEYNFWDLDTRKTVFVHREATASDYASRTGLLVSDLASIYKTGELQVLADIAEAGNG